MGELNKITTLEGGEYKDVVLDNTVEKIGADTVKLYSIQVNNIANTDKSVLHVWDNSAEPPVFGTDEPDWILPCNASGRELFNFTQDSLHGDTFTNEIHIAVTTGANVNTPPTNTVTGTIKTDGT